MNAAVLAYAVMGLAEDKQLMDGFQNSSRLIVDGSCVVIVSITNLLTPFFNYITIVVLIENN